MVAIVPVSSKSERVSGNGFAPRLPEGGGQENTGPTQVPSWAPRLPSQPWAQGPPNPQQPLSSQAALTPRNQPRPWYTVGA